MTFHSQHLSTFLLQALRRGVVILAAAILTWLGMTAQVRADGSNQLVSGGQVWYNQSTGIVEDIVTPFGGNTSLPIEPVWLYKIGASGYYQGFSPAQNGLTLNIWQVGYIPNMIVVRCSRRQGCSGMLESNNVTITPPACPTILISPTSLPNALQNVYYSPFVIEASGGTTPYVWSMQIGSLPPGLSWAQVGNEVEVSGVPTIAGTYSFTFKVTDATGVCFATNNYTFVVVNTNISIGDRIWNDLDKDGIQDAGEPGLSGRTVYLLNNAGSAVFQSTTTDSSGYYQMDYITGGSYRIGMDVDSAVILSPANVGLDTNDNDFTATIGSRWVTDVININASTADIDGGIYFGQDFGDLPAPYPTTGTLGASHTRHLGLRLGANYDFETAGQPNATATGDDVAGTPDDEDGVTTFPAFTAGATSTVSVSVLNSTGVAQRLYSFFDWNADGDFVDAGEAITSVLVNHLNLQQTINVSVPVPAGTTSGQKGVRFRLSDQAVLTATGASTNGEVEDYLVTVACPAVTLSGPGAFPNGLVGTAYPAQTFTASGGTAPYMWSMSPSIPGMSISSAGVLAGTPTAGGTYNVTITATGANNCSGTRAITIIINACPSAITLLAGETYTLTANGVVSAFWLVNTGSGAVPISGANGLSYVVSVPGTYTWIGLDALGCVIEGCCPMTFTGSVDYGDLADTTSGTGTGNYQTLLENSGAVHWTTNSTLRLGAAADADANGQPNATATGDDIAGTTPDDEDSISAMPTFARGQAFSIPVSYFNSIAILPYLYGFIDWNQDGDFGDAGETLTPVGLGQSALQQSVNLTGAVPANAVLGTTGARFRFTTATGVSATGVAPNGEVEDYMVTVTCPTITVNPATLTNPIQGFAYSTALSAAGGSGPYTFAITSGSLPTGLTMTSAGVISGTATSSAASPFTVRATDANSCSGSQAYTLTPVITDFGDWNGAGAATTTTTSTRNANLRLGATVDAETAVTPNAAATDDDTTNTGSADDEDGATTLPATITKGTNSTITLSVFNNTGANAFLHSWIDLNGDGTFNDGVVSTSPGERLEAVRTIATSATAQTVNITFTVPSWAVAGTQRGVRFRLTNLNTTTPTGASGAGEIEDYVTTVACSAITITQSALTAYISTAYSQTLTATGGTAPYTNWTVTTGTLPVGLTLSSAGVLSGTPSVIGSSTITISTADSFGCPASGSLTINVKGMTLGNQVWLDNNNNGSLDAGEPSVSGAQVILMNHGADNVISGAVADVQVGSLITTPASGLYSFANLPPGNYYVRVIAPSYLTHSSGTPATTDNNVNNNNDGAQPGGVGTELRSPIINLAPGAESITDGDTDNDTNLTLDFGLWAPLGVGNIVFIDLNGDGNLDVNEGLEGVLVQIFPQGAAVTSTPAGAAITDDKGRYFIDGLNPGNYFLHIPASQFATGSPLAGMFPMNSVVAGDDNVGQDLIAAATPATTGASTAVFTLTPAALPTGTAEPGFEGFVDDAFIDSNIDFTRDLGLRSASGTGFPLSIRERTVLERTAMPAAETESQTESVTFASWSESHGDAEDGDLCSNLLEYALDSDPADGRSGAGSFRLETNATTGTADAVFTRPANGRADIRYEVELSVDGNRWTKLAIKPQLSIGADGRQIVRYNAVDGSNVFAGEARGMVRLKVSLDANLDGSAEDAAITPINMFSRETFTSGSQRTFSMPLVNIELFAGNVSSSGKVVTVPQRVVLPERKELYVQDLVSGQIYEVDEKASVMPKLTLTLTPDGALSRIALRVHHRLSSLLPEDLFSSGNSAETADRVLSFDPESNNFSIAHLSSEGWMRDKVDVSDTIIVPLSAVLVHTRGEEVSVLLTGQVVPQISIKPATSTRLLGTSSILADSADRLGLNAEKGYRSATEPAEAARLRLWKADADSADTGYDQLYLNRTGWQRQDDSTGADLSAERLLKPFRGFFLVP